MSPGKWAVEHSPVRLENESISRIVAGTRSGQLGGIAGRGMDRAHVTRKNNPFIIFCLNKNNKYIIEKIFFYNIKVIL